MPPCELSLQLQGGACTRTSHTHQRQPTIGCQSQPETTGANHTWLQKVPFRRELCVALIIANIQGVVGVIFDVLESAVHAFSKNREEEIVWRWVCLSRWTVRRLVSGVVRDAQNSVKASDPDGATTVWRVGYAASTRLFPWRICKVVCLLRSSYAKKVSGKGSRSTDATVALPRWHCHPSAQGLHRCHRPRG